MTDYVCSILATTLIASGFARVSLGEVMARIVMLGKHVGVSIH